MVEISNQELARRIDAGFGTLATKIDVVKTRLDSHERRIDEQQERLVNKALRLERIERDMERLQEDSERRQAPATVHHQPAAPAPVSSDHSSKAITRWDLTVFCAAVYVLMELAPKWAAWIGGLGK